MPTNGSRMVRDGSLLDEQLKLADTRHNDWSIRLIYGQQRPVTTMNAGNNELVATITKNNNVW